MSNPSQNGAGNKLLLAVSVMSAFWMTYQYGGTFFDRSSPILKRMLSESDLWLWSDLVIGLWYFAAWVVFFVVASVSTHLVLSLLLGWVLTRFFF
jgi:hypothetical protein